MNVFINPGSGPVADATHEQAAANVCAFIADVAAKIGCDPAGVTATHETTASDGGRYPFTLIRGERRCEVDMPGIPTDRVRWMREPGQNIWDYPRLYVDGSSWVWWFAIGCAADQLSGTETEPDE